MLNPFFRALPAGVLALALAGCAGLGIEAPDRDTGPLHSAYTVLADRGDAIARVITPAASCPAITVDGVVRQMTLRAAAEVVPARDAGKKDSKPAIFPLRSCDAPLPRGTVSATVGKFRFPIMPAEPKRIVILGDTGCRMKQAENEFQPCNDAGAWPFAAIIQSALVQKPDLVIHVGDFHYRESPCPPGNAGCAGSPWGFGMDAWDADFFTPAAPLLKAAPWVFVRGNHESCARAGQGWFRFLDNAPFSAARSCDKPENDGDADYSPPTSLPIAADTQLIMFDSARAGLKGYGPNDAAYKKYLPQLQQVDRLAAQKPHSFFIAHHPVLAYAPNPTGGPTYPGNRGLQSVMEVLHPQRLFPAGVDLALHGHVHLFEALSFASDHPATVVIGHSGSGADVELPASRIQGLMPAPGAVVADFASRASYGFARLERAGKDWQLTDFDVQGRKVFECRLKDGKSRCLREGDAQP